MTRLQMSYEGLENSSSGNNMPSAPPNSVLRPFNPCHFFCDIHPINLCHFFSLFLFFKMKVTPTYTNSRLSLSFLLSSVIKFLPVYFLSLILYSFPKTHFRIFFLNKINRKNDALKVNASLLSDYSCHHFFQNTKITEINQVNDSQANKHLSFSV